MPAVDARRAAALPEHRLRRLRLHDGAFEALERGRINLIVNADDGTLPKHLTHEILFDDELACVVAAESAFKRRVTLKQYVRADHIGVAILAGRQTIPDARLAAVGAERRVVLRVPYFSAAIRSVAGTSLIATVPRRLAAYEAHHASLRVVLPPPELSGYRYLMAWHPRVDNDAAHGWLRATMRTLGRRLMRD